VVTVNSNSVYSVGVTTTKFNEFITACNIEHVSTMKVIQQASTGKTDRFSQLAEYWLPISLLLPSAILLLLLMSS